MKDSDIKVVGLSAKSKGKTNWKIVGALIGIVVLALGIIAGILLVRQNQNIKEQASCVAECPADDGVLRSCVGSSDGTLQSLCNEAGRIEICGQTTSIARQFCCPSAGAAWTTNLSLCPQATATATATATASATGTAAATATATATSTSSTIATATATGTGTATRTATATATSTSAGNKTATPTSTSKSTGTAFPVPETGADWPTLLGAGFGIVMILVSLGLAL